MITHLKFASIPTRDQDRALKFWTEKMGFELQTDQPMGPQRWIELSVRNSNTGIVLWTQEGQEDRGSFPAPESHRIRGGGPKERPVEPLAKSLESRGR